MPIFGPDGEFQGYRGSDRDITQRKRAEEELARYRTQLETLVQERTAHLEAMNREMEAFNYAVSHDLRAPLRAITGFSEILLEDYRDRLDDTGRDYLRRISAAAVRMATLIDALLSLSRLTRSQIEPILVDLSGMARAVGRGLAERYPERGVTLIVQDGLGARGDPVLLQGVLENLLGNAWKYTARCSVAYVEVGIEQHEGETAFYVRDNGAGFDMTYAGKLFGAFQRLHSPAEFEGTGIGLATVQRIVHRHGGRVWAYGEVGRGATFWFTLGRA
jgi:light-regulated signal transduction histidine kinase (bacteriophytochrome)